MKFHITLSVIPVHFSVIISECHAMSTQYESIDRQSLNDASSLSNAFGGNENGDVRGFVFGVDEFDHPECEYEWV